MTTALWVLIGVGILAMLFCYACCYVAGRADERAERAYRAMKRDETNDTENRSKL